jgi:hypothetical protein
MGNVKEEYLKKDLAGTNERATLFEKEAADTRLEQERLKGQMAWRRITAERYQILIVNLKEHPMEVWLTFVGNDPEATVFREDIDRTLDAAGIKTKFFVGTWLLSVYWLRMYLSQNAACLSVHSIKQDCRSSHPRIRDL